VSCYFVARITIHDPAGYGAYLDGFDQVFAQHDGEVVAVDESPRPLEGEWSADRLVLIRFPDEAAARRWYDSPEYQKLIRVRQRAAEAEIVLATGRD
jgi:uncharacterized protein (DUF1330 family)